MHANCPHWIFVTLVLIALMVESKVQAQEPPASSTSQPVGFVDGQETRLVPPTPKIPGLGSEITLAEVETPEEGGLFEEEEFSEILKTESLATTSTEKLSRSLLSTSRQQTLSAVVRLKRGRALVCTGVLVVWKERVGIVTAAHCLYARDRYERLLGRFKTIDIEGIGTYPTEQAKVPELFEVCAQEHLPYANCIGSGVADVAFLPLEADQHSARGPWALCTKEPRNETLTVFGYGPSRTRVSKRLLQGTLSSANCDLGSQCISAGHEQIRVVFGDSGGPVVAATQAARMGSARPQVCFIVAAARSEDPLHPEEGQASAILQPIWALEKLLIYE